jgi:hypothetical protein
MEEYQIRHRVRTHQGPGGVMRNPDSVRKLWEHWEASGIEKPKELETIITPAEDRSHTLHILADVLVATRRYTSNELLDRISCAQVPLGLFEASVLPMDDGGHFILLDTYLEAFLSFSSFAGLACGFERPSADAVTRITEGLFRELDRFLGFGNWDHQGELFDEMAKKSYDASVMAAYTQMAMTTFILAHEIAHVVLGHTKATRRLYVAGREEEVAIEVLLTSHDEELAADEFAWRIYREIVRGAEVWPTVKLEALYDGVPLYLFDLLEVLNKRFALVNKRPPFDPHHPLPKERRARLLAAHPEMLHDWSRSLYDGLAEFAEHLLENCEACPVSNVRMPRPKPIDL